MPKLATLVGLNESIVLQQIHYWLNGKEQRQQDYIDGRYWVYNTYEQWQEQFPFWSIMTIRRTFTKLENMGLLIVGNYNTAGFDKTKWYSVDYAALDRLVSPSVQNEHIVCSNCYNRCAQNEQTNTIDYTGTTTKKIKGLKGAELKQLHTSRTDSTVSTAGAAIPFNPSILEKQIMKSCKNHSVKDSRPFVDIISYYYSAYNRAFGKEHPRLSARAMDSVISSFLSSSGNLDGLEYDPEAYHAIIDRHFQTQYQDCDYNICHFMSEEVRNNRYYETCY